MIVYDGTAYNPIAKVLIVEDLIYRNSFTLSFSVNHNKTIACNALPSQAIKFLITSVSFFNPEFSRP